jgi:hypothetical protein
VSELAFPLLGAIIVVMIILPVCGVMTKLALVVLERQAGVGPLQGLTARFLLLAGSGVLPLAWFLSAGLHQAETGRSALACLFVHGATALCFESSFFAAALGAVVVSRSVGLVKSSVGARATQNAPDGLAARLDRIIDGHSMLRSLRGRLGISDAEDFSIGTHGLLRPRVLVGSAFAARLTDDMLASALAHEIAHARSWDPLRYLMVELSLAVNPFGRFLLEPHARRWYVAREAHCDREAVIQGCRPLALAEAIVRAARPSTAAAVPLGAPDMGVLRLRVGMLMAFAERKPSQPGHGASALPTAFALLVIVLLLPHQTGTGVLDALHRGVEHALTYILGS